MNFESGAASSPLLSTRLLQEKQMTFKYIFVGSQKNVRSTEIIYIQARANYSIVKMKDGREFLVATTLKKIEEKLEGCEFIRPHKSFLINTKYIINYNAGVLILTNGASCTCSRRKRQEMDSIFGSSGRLMVKMG